MNDALKCNETDNYFEIHYAERNEKFKFPKKDCSMLPMRNITCENLAAHLYLKFMKSLSKEESELIYKTINKLQLGVFKKRNEGSVITRQLYSHLWDFSDPEKLELFD